VTASLILSLDWRIGTYGFPITLWLTVGWLLLSAGPVTLLVFLLRLLWFSLGELVVEHPALTALPARGDRVQGNVR
jgi:hypothetical protein